MFNERTGVSTDGGEFHLSFLVLGVAHAVPILIIAWYTKSKTLTWITALVMAFVAVKFGSSSYAILDLIFVAVGLWLGLGVISEPKSDLERFQERVNRHMKD